jgi:hypothetical protein
MRQREQREPGRPPGIPAAETISATTKGPDPGHSSAADKALPTVRAVGLAPSGVWKFWSWVIGRCPYCHGAHLHRGGPAGGQRRAGCGRGRYEVTSGRRRRS